MAINWDRFQELENSFTEKQKLFGQMFAIHGDAIRAGREAGYKDGNSLNSFVYRLLYEPKMEEYIGFCKQIQASNNEVTKQQIVEEMKRMAFFDVSQVIDAKGNLKSKAALSKHGKIIKKIKHNPRTGGLEVEFYDKQEALLQLAKYVGFFEKDNEQKKEQGVQFYLPDNGRPDSSDD